MDSVRDLLLKAALVESSLTENGNETENRYRPGTTRERSFC